ncbi:MAG: aminopeptidase P family protein [Succinivibrionaceae bacterium]|nr:aminopeptidase P family protein [Succinivibrionaceae bacterium]
MFKIDLYEKNLQELRSILNTMECEALLIPHSDEFLGEYLPESGQRLAFVTGFTGSAGYCVVFRSEQQPEPAVLFVDGRYTVQAKKQVAEGIKVLDLDGSEGDFTAVRYLAARLKSGSGIAFDPNLHSYSWYLKAADILDQAGMKLVAARKNPVDQIWRARPEDEKQQIIIFPESFIGMSSLKKRELISIKINDAGLDAFFISNCESVNWLLNIRGHDIPYLPVVRCFAIIYSNQSVDVFIDNDKLVASKFTQQCGNDVSIFDFSRIGETLKRLGDDQLKIGMDFTSTNASTVLALTKAGAKISNVKDPCELPRAIKTSTEVNGFRSAHVKDGVAMCRFLAWLDRRCENKAEETEATIARQAEKFRQDQEYFIELSFATISALGPNAAMCHYNYENEEKPRQLGEDAIYLIDSGAHYYDGTTDITRTVCVGAPTDEMKDNFTRVLKGNIALATAVFPAGTYGYQLDILARKELWDVGLDYRHGTGHGVGHCLSVHEGPHRISSKSGADDAKLVANMIVTDEPGYYKEGEYGIRCENELLVMTNPAHPSMLSFEVLTLVPFDLRLVNADLLTEAEITWLNEYHQRVRDTIKPYLTDQEIGWLIGATKQIEGRCKKPSAVY